MRSPCTLCLCGIQANTFFWQLGAGKLKKLRPAFKPDGGSVTAGNASSISDGAAALFLAKIRGYALSLQAESCQGGAGDPISS
ncbi:hypothetical protein M758_UG195600 [Ceratodon purpureus]|nr:hypothetical protein M758_UG195600 [Ceratodon purpureus]